MRNGVREAKAGAAAEIVLRVGKATARVDAGLVRIETATTGMSEQVTQARSEVSALQARLTLWLDLGAIALTILFLWFLFAHVVTFVLGLSLLRNKNLFERWVGAPAPVVMAEPIDAMEPPKPTEPAVPVEAASAMEPSEDVGPAELAEADESTEPDTPGESTGADETFEPAEASELFEGDEAAEPVESVEGAETPEAGEPQDADDGEQ
jgi:hypothetical protein